MGGKRGGSVRWAWAWALLSSTTTAYKRSVLFDRLTHSKKENHTFFSALASLVGANGGGMWAASVEQWQRSVGSGRGG